MTLTDFKKHEVSFIGWLMSMTHREARSLVATAGGQVVRSPSGNASVLVVGNGDKRLRATSQVSSVTIRARRYKNRFANLNLLSEMEFLEIFGLSEKIENLGRLFTAAQISRVLGVPTRDIRSWIRQRLIQPAKTMRRLRWFDFREITVVQTVKMLIDQGLTAAHISNSIQELSSWLPSHKTTMTQFELFAHSTELAVRLKTGILADPRGQLLFDFDHDRPTAEISPIFPSNVECVPDVVQEMSFVFGYEEEQFSLNFDSTVLNHRNPSTSDRSGQSLDELFRLAVLAEDTGDWELARFFYDQALARNNSDPEILFNYGNVLYQQGYKLAAAKNYLRAIIIDPHYLEPFNNLGNSLAEIGRLDDAIRIYRHVLSLRPDYVDARSNLAETLVSIGSYEEARFHWMYCLAIEPNCPWADITYSLLRSLPRCEK